MIFTKIKGYNIMFDSGNTIHSNKKKTYTLNISYEITKKVTNVMDMIVIDCNIY